MGHHHYEESEGRRAKKGEGVWVGAFIHAQCPQQHRRDDRQMKLTGFGESFFVSIMFHPVIIKRF